MKPKAARFNLIVKLTSVTAFIYAASAFSEHHRLVVSRHEPLENLPSKFCCIPDHFPKLALNAVGFLKNYCVF